MTTPEDDPLAMAIRGVFGRFTATTKVDAVRDRLKAAGYTITPMAPTSVIPFSKARLNVVKDPES